MSEPVLDVATSGEVATLTLNRPEAMNALSGALREAIASTFAELEADPDVTVVILTGAGRAFCAGIDLKELSTDSDVGFRDIDMLRQIRAFRGPIIGAINGHAITGGFELALACDVRIASTQACFADTHARVGILPGWGLSQILARLVGISRAKEISLTGNFVSAEQAEAWGLVNRVVEPAELLPTCRALADDMLSCDRASLLDYKRLIDDGFRLPFGDALALETRVSREAASRVSPESIAQRRAGILARGRSQSSG
jgi:enoyl-CoA hydratase